MINLLPPEHRTQLRAAQANTLLLRYNIALVAAVIFLALALGFVYLYLSSSKANAERTITENQAKVGTYAQVENEAQSFRTSLTTAKQVLDKEVTYSKTVLAIAQLMPKGTVLQDLNLDVATFGTPTTLVFQAKDYDTALAIKDTFQASPLLSNVHLQSISQATGEGYPFTVTLGLTINKDAAK
jgi:hypothetical protein